MKSGVLIVISGPSGVGKGTVVKELLKRRSDVSLSVSATTRKPRIGEVEGVNYFFKTDAEFDEMLVSDGFLEHFEIYGNRYGTPKDAVLRRLESNSDVILEIDVQGGLEIKRRFNNAVLIFILPPSAEILRSRLVGRKSESAESLERRTQAAVDEIKKCKFYDYAVLNDSLDNAVCGIINIIESERLRSFRNVDLIDKIAGGKQI